MSIGRRGFFGLFAGAAATTTALATAKAEAPKPADGPFLGQLRAVYYDPGPVRQVVDHGHVMIGGADPSHTHSMTLAPSHAHNYSVPGIEYYEQWDGKEWVRP